MTLKDQVILVAGGGGALGQAVLAVARAQGATVLAMDARVDHLGDLADVAIAVDLLDAAAVGAALTQLLNQHARIDALVNVVGGFAMGDPVHATSADLIEQMLDLNVRTVLNTVQAVVPHMQQQQHGRVVNVGAVAAQAGVANMGAYVASKSMLMRLTESMAEELRAQGINVNGVLPSIIDTPANRAAMPEAAFDAWVRPSDLAAVICFLCSDAARAVHGALIPVRGLS